MGKRREEKGWGGWGRERKGKGRRGMGRNGQEAKGRKILASALSFIDLYAP